MAGDKDWTAGQVVTAADMDDYVQLQTVQKFASAAARDTALSARKREGMITYQDDTNTFTVYSGSAWSTLGPVNGAWTDWTPTITQSGTVTYTDVRSAYTRFGRKIQTDGVLSVTGSGTSTNLVTVTLPVNAASTNANTVLGAGWIFDSSASQYYFGIWVPNSASTAKLQITSVGGSAAYAGLASFTAGLASGDVVTFQFTYEAADDA